MYESLVPISNFKGVHNFQTGTGKSPSFFFFSDNKILMVKTLKESEFKILFDHKFMVDYYKHLINNRDSLLSRILGVYEIQVNDQSPIIFFITENMIGDDYQAIKRCYDLKGSLHDRVTKISAYEQMTGETGFKVLKDQNFIMLKDKLDIDEEKKENVLRIL